jgi:predicted ArsR family transcriptional regulator
MDLPSSDDVLAQRTRARTFSWLSEQRAPAGTEQVAAALEMHPNGVRRHLERLAEAGLVERSRSKGGRGRPGDRWAVAADADPGGESPTAYADLARWLVRAIPPGRNRLREIEKAGREIGRELAPGEPGEEPVESLLLAIASLGFQPELKTREEGELVCQLGNCPYRESVRENQPVVCALHRGITGGLVAQLMPEAKLDRFEPRDPDRAGCVVGVSGPVGSDD